MFLILETARRRRRSFVVLVAFAVLTGCGDPDTAPRDASTVADRADTALDVESGVAIDAGEEDASVSDAETSLDGEVEVDAGRPNGCDRQSDDLLAATLDPAWRVIESVEPHRQFERVRALAADAAGRVHTVEDDPQIGRIWGVWPNIAPTNRTFDPVPPELRPTSTGDLTTLEIRDGMLIAGYRSHIFFAADRPSAISSRCRAIS